jgi:hypothetical protein
MVLVGLRRSNPRSLRYPAAPLSQPDQQIYKSPLQQNPRWDWALKNVGRNQHAIAVGSGRQGCEIRVGRPCSSFSIRSNHTVSPSLNWAGCAPPAERPAGVAVERLSAPHSLSLINRSITRHFNRTARATRR